MEAWYAEDKRVIEEGLRPCPFCGGDGVLEKKGNSVSYWIVRCSICRAVVKGTYEELAVSGWNNRPTREWQPLDGKGHSFLLPGGQKYQHLLVYDSGKVTFIDYIDEKVAASVDIDLGNYRICAKRGKEKGDE